MQGVKPDTAAAGIVEGGCQQMIEVDQHGRDHQNIGEFPASPEKKPDDDRRYQEMQCEMVDTLFRA